MEELFGDLAKILLPAAAVLYAMYLTVKAFLSKDFEKRLIELKIKNNEIILPIRLQAYERMCLFLERISPHNILLRVNEQGYTSAAFQQRMLHEIREEFNHNLSQQVYMSDGAWATIKGAMDEIISVINQAAIEIPKEAPSIELGKRVFEKMSQREDPIERALRAIKSEIQKAF